MQVRVSNSTTGIAFLHNLTLRVHKYVVGDVGGDPLPHCTRRRHGLADGTDGVFDLQMGLFGCICASDTYMTSLPEVGQVVLPQGQLRPSTAIPAGRARRKED
jgi:hypothetical protein